MIKQLPEDGDSFEMLTSAAIESNDEETISDDLTDSYIPLLDDMNQGRTIAKELNLDYP